MAAPFQNYSGGVLLADIVKRNNLSTYVSEAIKERSLFLKSGAVVRNSLLDSRAGGTRIQVPEFNPVAPTEEIMDGTATWGTSTAGYLTPQKIGTGTQVATICHRGFAYAVDDVAVLAAGEDPMLHIRNQLADAINKLNSARLFSQLNGLFAGGSGLWALITLTWVLLLLLVPTRTISSLLPLLLAVAPFWVSAVKSWTLWLFTPRLHSTCIRWAC